MTWSKIYELSNHVIPLGESMSELNAGFQSLSSEHVEVEVNQKFIRSALSEMDLASAQTKGKAMTLEQALAFASEQP